MEVAKQNPKMARRDKISPINGDQFALSATISKEGYENLKRCGSLAAQKGESPAIGKLIERALTAYRDRHDPVRKAERAERRKSKTKVEVAQVHELCTYRVEQKTSKERIPLTAEQKNAVFLRDQGRCTHVNAQGHVSSRSCTSIEFANRRAGQLAPVTASEIRS